MERNTLEFLKSSYEENAVKWRDQHDDRRLYSNSYFLMVEAISSLDDEPNVFVKVAMDNHITVTLELLDRIKSFFKNRG